MPPIQREIPCFSINDISSKSPPSIAGFDILNHSLHESVQFRFLLNVSAPTKKKKL